MAKILQVKPFFPLPANQGTRRVSLSLLGDLVSEHEVTYLCQYETEEEKAYLPELETYGAQIVTGRMPNRISRLHRLVYKVRNTLASWATGIPQVCFYWSNPHLGRQIRHISSTWEPDVTILESWETFLLRSAISHGKAVLLAHDAAYRIREREAQAEPDPRRQARLLRAAKVHRQWEIEAWKRFDAVLTLTQDDALSVEEDIQRDSSLKRAPIVRHLPVAVNPHLFEVQRRERGQGMTVGFLGSFKADFNIDALRFLSESVWPRLKKLSPAVRLVVAGNGHAADLKQQCERAGIEWLGFVEDLGRFFESLDVFVVPLRFAGGVRIRILEALAAGTPVVATPVAAAGLSLEPGKHLLLGDNADEIAGAVYELLKNPERRESLAREGRRWCQSTHGPEATRERRLAIVREILSL